MKSNSFLCDIDGIEGVINDKLDAFISMYGCEPVAILVGPDDFLELLEALKVNRLYTDFEVAVKKVTYFGRDVMVKRENGIDFVIDESRLYKFTRR